MAGRAGAYEVPPLLPRHLQRLKVRGLAHDRDDLLGRGPDRRGLLVVRLRLLPHLERVRARLELGRVPAALHHCVEALRHAERDGVDEAVVAVPPDLVLQFELGLVQDLQVRAGDDSQRDPGEVVAAHGRLVPTLDPSGGQEDDAHLQLRPERLASRCQHLEQRLFHCVACARGRGAVSIRQEVSGGVARSGGSRRGHAGAPHTFPRRTGCMTPVHADPQATFSPHSGHTRAFLALHSFWVLGADVKICNCPTTLTGFSHGHRCWSTPEGGNTVCV